MPSRILILFLVFLVLVGRPSSAQSTGEDRSAGTQAISGDALLDEYFRAETDRLTRDSLAEIKTLEDWTARRQEYRRQLLEMLGLDPLPDRTPLEPVITGTVEKDGVLVENLYFQSRPGLYVTGNLYRPVNQDGPLPAILYVCGHGGAKQDGISLGNKTTYQHHGAWFARHGYVCLTIDTIQLGEIEGIHHGTYRERMWWWNNRGYTPAGVEAWNCVRSLDYLQSRPEVDGERLGITGRSGGGAYSWWTAAIDDRIQVAVPVAGITSLKNHVVDGCVEGHCDCMYMVNTYQWDFPMVAALVAPRPLLISNSDKDRIFPLDGVIDVHAKVRRIYELYGASGNLGLQITEGPHKDTQELRVHAFRWFNRFLRNDHELLRSPATPYFEKSDLRVFATLPQDEIVSSIHETFVPAVTSENLPTSLAELQDAGQQWIESLREKTFRGWPVEREDSAYQVIADVRHNGVRLRTIEFTSQDPFRLQIHLLSSADDASDTLELSPVTQQEWESLAAALAVPFAVQFPDAEPSETAWRQLESRLASGSLALILPRGVGPTKWTADERKQTQIRRRFMLLGQTLSGMQTYDVLRAIRLLRGAPELRPATLRLSASGEAASWALFASLFAGPMNQLQLADLPARNRESLDLLNVSRYVEMPHVAMLAASQTGRLQLRFADEEARQAWKSILKANPLAHDLIEIEATEPR